MDEARQNELMGKLVRTLRDNGALPRDGHHPCMISGTERFFRAGYKGPLIAEWLPALDGVIAKLEQGARVAGIGCGHGASAAIMAQAFPKSSFAGFDAQAPLIDNATQGAEEGNVGSLAGLFDGSAQNYPGGDYDLICFFHCLHEMKDPVGAARHAYESLKDDGTVLLVESFADDRPAGNLNAVGRSFYAASTFNCTPDSLPQDGPRLGAQTVEVRLRKVFVDAGFKQFRRATQTPFNLILEARK
ncbi:class I SAM-dependent methyltransferase [Pseudomonas sp. SWRI153]|uniref:Class I SAM-dependent methyltransferase n=1 Tax=Pseudomonas khorasanensis TaxID=2745508 RepID=A0A923F7G1_9PSED|nr:class I SAM-dependent methyltransferase [Pseudomonas khorasanensis]